MKLINPRMSALAFALITVVTLSGCANRNVEANNDAYNNYDYDPIEPVNRGIFKFNEIVDAGILKPVAKGYRYVVPEPARKGVGNVLSNLMTPVSFFNSVLQGNTQQAHVTFWRFMLNSTLGFGGIRDFASEQGLIASEEDFGQTLGRYGVGSGGYFVIPLLGPSNFRDAPSKVADYFMDPFNMIVESEVSNVKTATSVIHGRSEALNLTDEIYRNSLDPYATIRSGFTQKRVEDIRIRK